MADVTDTFNRADNGSSLGSTDGGADSPLAWAPLDGSVWAIESNRAKPVTWGGSFNGTFAGVPLSIADSFTMEVDVAVLPDSGQTAGLFFRFIDANNYLALGVFDRGGGSFTLEALGVVGGINGGWPVSGAAAFATGIVAGDRIGLLVEGDEITVSLNGTALDTVTEPTHAGADDVGLFAFFPAAERLDNFALGEAIPPALPTVDSVTPDSGTAFGGTEVVIAGTNFVDVTDVDFGDTPAASFEVEAVVLSSDSFNRADSASSLGSTDGDGTLDPLAWTPGGTSGISGNRAYTPTIGGLNNYIDLATGDVDLSLDLAVVSNAAALLFRRSDESNFWMFYQDPSLTALYRVVAGVHTQIGGAAGSTGGDTLRVVAIGSEIQTYRNGVAFTAASHAFNATETEHGFRSYSANERFDNWLAVDTVDRIIRAVTPPHAAGTVQVVVTNPFGSSNE